MKKVHFVTTNHDKFIKFRKAVPHVEGVEIMQLEVETPEIQARDNKDVAQYSAKWAADKYNVPVIKEDVGMYIEALDGFPGPYLNHVEKWIQADGFMALLKDKKSRKAKYELCVAYCEPGKEPICFSTYITGSFGYESKGKGGWIVDKLFIPDGGTKTIAELIDANEFARNEDHYLDLAKLLTQ
jgi:XTP/dITP diphosphohydrolase